MSRILIYLLTFLFFSSVVPNISAQQRIARLFDNDVPVAGDYTSFCQDRDGFIWVGTDRGLLCFDGNSYDVYRHDDSVEGSLSDNRILGLLCDSKGRVWVATANGLNLYDAAEDNFKVIPLPSKDFYGYIIGLAEQSDGTVTFLVSGVGLYIVSDKNSNDTPVAVKYLARSFEAGFNSIVSTPSGRLYIGSGNGTVYSMAPNGGITPIKVSEGAYIVSLSVEEDGNVLACTTSDIFRINTSTFEFNRLECDTPLYINNLSNSTKSGVYVATSGKGLWSVSPKSDIVSPCVDIFCPFLNLAVAKIGAVFGAPDGNLWLGCNYSGIVMVPGKNIPFVYRKLNHSFPDFGGGMSAMTSWKGNVITCIDKGRIGVFSPEGKLIKTSVIPDSGAITHIQPLSDNSFLLSVANSGLWTFDAQSGAVSKFLDIPGKFRLLVSAPGNPGEIFIGVHGVGIMRYDMNTGDKKWLPYKAESNTLSNPFVACMTRTNDGKVWIGLYGGIACFDLKTNRFIEIDQEPFLKGATFAIAPCLTDESVWVGTSHGLIHLDPKKGVLEKFTTANGLSDNDVRTITRDHTGAKWIGTMKGLSYIPADNDTIFSFYGGNGLVENSFNHARFAPESNTVFLGSDQGITSFRPDSLSRSVFDNEIKVSAVFINGKRIAPNSNKSLCEVVHSSGADPDVLRLSYKDNALTFRLSTMDFRDASNIRYMWRLDKKEQWIVGHPGENTINLSHLDPGTYNLEICAVENNVVSPVKRIRIEVSYPWYWTIWAKLVYIFIFLSIVALAFIVFKKKKEEEVNEDKIKFFTDISHDIRTPMTLVMSPLESLMKNQTDPETNAKLNVMHRNAQRVMGLLNQLLDIQKLDKGKMRLSCRATDSVVFIKEMVELFAAQAADKKQTLTFTEISNPGVVWIDRDNFDKILSNLLSNAIKYTPEGGDINVSVDVVEDSRLGRSMQVKITDTGIGIDPKFKQMLFEPFYRIRESHASATVGFGIGLDLCRRLVKLHHGEISAENREDGTNGSVFTVTLPLDESVYQEGELVECPSDDNESGRHLIMSGSTTAAEISTRPKPISAGGKVLVVDDDNELRGYIASILSKYYKVKMAANGSEALKIVGDWIPDIVISDVVMPEMDGLTLLKRMKSNANFNHIPVVLLSSKTSLSDRMSGWDKGADGYLGKPFNADELSAMVDTLIENRQRLKGKFSGAQDIEGKIDAPEMKGNDELLLERIMKVINAHIDDPDLNVEKLSMEVGVSRAQLHRKMKDLIGMTPSDYIRNIRLKRACELLRRPDIEVTQVAYKIGFTSQPHFSSHFKRYT
ncbi:MAG: response regulator, partial [Muribaculaceae bacterium]|nr:response regulator [Muribaculaceae bacterium]